MNQKNILLGVLVAIIGLLVMINPESSIKIIVILLGIGALADGIYSLAKMRNLIEDNLYSKSVLIRSIISIVVGVFAVCLPIAFFDAMTTIIRIMLYVVAVHLILSAAAQIFAMIRLSQNNFHNQSKGLFWTAIGSIAIAILLFMLPKDYGQAIIRVVGAIIMVGGIGYTIWGCTHKAIVVEPENVRDEQDSEQTTENDSAQEATEATDTEN